MALTIPKSLAGTPASIKSQAEALLAKATTLAEVNSILALARSSNVTPDSALVTKTKTAIADAGKQTTATATAKAAADKAAADKAAADAAAAKAKAAATAPGTVSYAAKTLGMSEAEFTAAAKQLIATNPTYKNRDVSYVAGTIGAKTGDLSSQVKLQDKAIKDLAIADKAAQAQGFANANAKKEADNAAANRLVQSTQYNSNVKNSSSIDALNANIQTAKQLGFTVDQANIDSAVKSMTSGLKTIDEIQAFNAKGAASGIKVPAAQTQQVIKESVGAVKSFDELKALDTKVQGIGQKLDQSLVDSAVDTISRASGATTREGLAALQKSAEAAGYKPSQSYVDQQTAVLDKADADAAAKAAADQAAREKVAAEKQAKIDTFKSTLLQPGTAKFNEAAQFSQVYKIPNTDISYLARTENKITGEPAGWYESVDGGKSYRPAGASQDAPGMTKAELNKAYFTDWAGNKLVDQGYKPEEATKMVQDYTASYDDKIGSAGPANSYIWTQGLDQLTRGPEAYARWQTQNVPSAKAEATKLINDKLSAGGYYNQVWTRDELNSIVQQAKEQGLPVDQNLVSKVDSAIANREKTLGVTLPPIAPNDLNDIGGAGATPKQANIDGRTYIAMPEDPVTGKPAGWYTYFYDRNDNLQYATADDYKSYLKTGVVPDTALSKEQYDTLANTTAANVKQVETGNEMKAWAKTVSDPAYLKDAAFNSLGQNKVDINFSQQAPDGSYWKYVPGNRDKGEAGQWYTAVPDTGGTQWKPATVSESGVTISDKPVAVAELSNQLAQVNTANKQSFDAQYAAEQAAWAAAHPYKSYAQDDGFELSFLDKLSLVTLIAMAAAPTVSSWFAGDAAGAAALSEGSSAAAGLAEAGMGSAEIAATLEASGIPTAAADIMAESAIAATTSGSGAVSAALSTSGITAETLAMANATLDPIAALTAAQGWTAVDMAYIASIGVPASVLATAEATNVAMGLPASEIGTAATAEVAGTVPPGTAAEVAASQPVAPAVDTSRMIPTVDAAGNPGFFDPATGNTLNSAGQVVAEGAMPAVSEGTQLASAYTPAQEAQYAELLGQGYSPAQAVEAIGAAAEGAAIPEILITGSTAPVITAEQAILGAAGIGGIGAIAGSGGGAAAPVAAAPTPPTPPTVPSTPAPAQPVQPAEVPVVDATPVEPVQPTQPAAPVETPVATQPTAPVEPGPYAPPTTTAPTELATPATSGQPAVPGTATQAPVYDAPPTSLPSTEVVPPPAVAPQYPTTAPTTPVDPANPYAPDNIDVGGGWNPAEVPVTDAVPVPAPGTGLPGTIPTGGLSALDLAKLYAGTQLAGALLVPKIPEIKRRTYAPLGPVQFGDVGRVNLPGTNPGQFVGVPAQYQTNNMQQSKFYWGQRPLQTGAEFSPEQYKQVAAPVTPWGLQQMYNPQTQTINSLLQGVQQASTQAPYNVPRAPRV